MGRGKHAVLAWFPQGNGRICRANRALEAWQEMQTAMSAAVVHRRASRACPRSWDRSIRPSCEYDRTSGTRMFGGRSRAIPPRALTAACGFAGNSDISAARWRKHAQTLQVEIQA